MTMSLSRKDRELYRLLPLLLVLIAALPVASFLQHVAHCDWRAWNYRQQIEFKQSKDYHPWQTVRLGEDIAEQQARAKVWEGRIWSVKDWLSPGKDWP